MYPLCQYVFHEDKTVSRSCLGFFCPLTTVRQSVEKTRQLSKCQSQGEVGHVKAMLGPKVNSSDWGIVKYFPSLRYLEHYNGQWGNLPKLMRNRAHITSMISLKIQKPRWQWWNMLPVGLWMYLPVLQCAPGWMVAYDDDRDVDGNDDVPPVRSWMDGLDLPNNLQTSPSGWTGWLLLCLWWSPRWWWWSSSRWWWRAIFIMVDSGSAAALVVNHTNK